MRAILRSQNGFALLIAIGVLTATTLVILGMMEVAASLAQASRRHGIRVQLMLTATSMGRFHHNWMTAILKDSIPQNILDQGCRQQTPDGWDCAVPGYDTSRTSGIRKDLLPPLVNQSRYGWGGALSSLVSALRNVMPPAIENDPYTVPFQIYGFGGAEFGGIFDAPIRSRWRTYSHIRAANYRAWEWTPGNSDRPAEARIYFDLAVHSWARAETGNAREQNILWQVTLLSEDSVIYLKYPHCERQPSFNLDSVCSYPEYVSITITPPVLITDDPGVVKDPWAVR
jgi:hypothetical protein